MNLSFSTMLTNKSDIIESACKTLDDLSITNSDGIRVVYTHLAKDILKRVLDNYERIVSFPKVDFWGEPVE